MRCRRIVLALALAAAGAVEASAAPGVVVSGGDQARVLPPTAAAVAEYANVGYEVAYGEGGVEIRVDLSPLASSASLALPPVTGGGEVEQIARRQVRGARTVYDAVTRILTWVRQEIDYDLDRSLPQDAESVLRRRSAYCAGTARLAVALLAAVGIEAREVPGYVYASAPGTADVRPGFHRWIEVRYPDRGWAYSDPLASQHFVPATYLRLAAESLEVAPAPGRLLERRDGTAAIDLAPAAPAGVRVRANDTVRSAAALVLRFAAGRRGEATLVGTGVRRRQPIVGGEARFLGLPNGRYELRVLDGGELAAWKSLTFRAPVLAELVIPSQRGGGAAGGGR